MDAESTRKKRRICKVLREKPDGRKPLGKMGTLYLRILNKYDGTE
jgi:hypothetical protein